MIDQAYKQKSKIKYGIVLSSVGIMCAIFIYTNALWAAQILSKKTFFRLRTFVNPELSNKSTQFQVACVNDMMSEEYARCLNTPACPFNLMA